MAEVLTDREFAQFQRFIYEAAGITLSNEKKALVAGRLAKRVNECRAQSYGAYFRMLEGHDAPDLKRLRAHLDEAGLARQKWPEEVRVVDDFPRTPSGKVKKYELRNQLREESTAR